MSVELRRVKTTTRGLRSGVNQVFQRIAGSSNVVEIVEDHAKSESKSELSLTVHFEEQWRKRGNGPVPTIHRVKKILKKSVQIQRYTELFTARGFRRKILALYWYPEEDLVIKVDERDGKVVTVLTPETAKEE